MLEIVNYNEGEYEFPCLLVLGCFDGLHIGHAELLKKAKLQAKINGLDLGVMLFADGKGGKQVYSFDERIALLEQFNVKFVVRIEFTNDFKNTKPLDFLQVLEDKLNVKAYMSGKDFRFGAGAKGKSSTLKNYCEDEENGVWYMPVKDVLSGSEKVSTTLIKSLLENGEIASANELLGRSFSATATVGETCGNQIKILYPQNKIAPQDGMYCVKCTVGENEYDGTASVGGDVTVTLEAFGGNIDGQQIKIEFLSACECVLHTEEPTAQPECEATEAEAEAVVELAVADITDEAENAEQSPIAEEVPADDVPAEAVNTEAVPEDLQFEDELEEEFVAPSAEETEEPSEELDEGQTLTELAEQETTENAEEDINQDVENEPEPENKPEPEDEGKTLTEIAEESNEEAEPPAEEEISDGGEDNG